MRLCAAGDLQENIRKSKKYRRCVQDILGTFMMVYGIGLFLYLNVNI